MLVLRTSPRDQALVANCGAWLTSLHAVLPSCGRTLSSADGPDCPKGHTGVPWFLEVPCSVQALHLGERRSEEKPRFWDSSNMPALQGLSVLQVAVSQKSWVHR